ncbi:hypothetical protein DES32_1904 [Methylovirgula ligni]|uniref:Sulfur globule protein n=1 Tax=Methylovirgula ligni TaxID=569860 RepID=A0A3D9YTE2_9HYPH|nr:hypothetical protein [Methylovirgula ligni]REF85866.1 hypothetical protein DES32_1904 [Methylovirgula ligni]
MKPNAIAVSLGLCAASMLIVPDTAQAFRGGFHGGGRHFAGGGHWHGGSHWHGGGSRWYGGYWRGGRWYGGGWGVGAAAAGAAAVGAAAAYGDTCYQQQNVWNGYQYVVQWVRVC